MGDPALFPADGLAVGGSEIHDAVERMFADLEERDLLGSVEAAKRAVLIKTARALDRGLETPRVSVATANLLVKALDVLDTLPATGDGRDSMDAWDLAALDATRSAMSGPEEDSEEFVDMGAPS